MHTLEVGTISHCEQPLIHVNLGQVEYSRRARQHNRDKAAQSARAVGQKGAIPRRDDLCRTTTQRAIGAARTVPHPHFVW